MATKQRSSAKADFVRSFPLSAPASEIVAKAKSAGLTVSPAHVYGVRKTMDASRPTATALPKTAAAAPGRAKDTPSIAKPLSAPQAGSKKAFVLSYPADTPAQEVVRAAAARGIDLSPGYLYWVRSEATRTGRRIGGTPRDHEVARRPSAPLGGGGSRDAERVIIETALRVVGIERAIAVLQAAQSRLGRLLDG